MLKKMKAVLVVGGTELLACGFQHLNQNVWKQQYIEQNMHFQRIATKYIIKVLICNVGPWQNSVIERPWQWPCMVELIQKGTHV